jgi:hypothetical protein
MDCGRSAEIIGYSKADIVELQLKYHECCDDIVEDVVKTLIVNYISVLLTCLICLPPNFEILDSDYMFFLEWVAVTVLFFLSDEKVNPTTQISFFDLKSHFGSLRETNFTVLKSIKFYLRAGWESKFLKFGINDSIRKT